MAQISGSAFETCVHTPSSIAQTPNIVIVDLTNDVRSWEGLATTCNWKATVIESVFSVKPETCTEADCIIMRAPEAKGDRVSMLARQIRQQAGSDDLPIIVVLSASSLDHADQLIQAGATDFVVEPLRDSELTARVNQQLRLRNSGGLQSHNQVRIEEQLQKRTKALRSVLERMIETERQVNKAHADTVRRLGVASEYKDEDTGEHISRVGAYARILARGIGMASDEADTLREASALHDVGKIGIPDAILLKPGKLDADEWTIMKTHTTIGAKILAGSKSHLLQLGEKLAMTHHEKWDGSGYPNGISGEDIPIEGRICAVADFYDAVSSDRPYRSAMPQAKVLSLLREGSGAHFDPRLIRIFFDNIEAITKIREQYCEREYLRSRRNPHPISSIGLI